MRHACSRAIPLLGFLMLCASAAAGADAPASRPAAVGGKLYRHATGGAFRYLSEWTVKETEGALALVPPDMKDEVYLVTAAGAPNIKEPGDPQVVATLEAQMRQLAPALKRVGEVEKVSIGSFSGAVLAWEGQAGGAAVTGRVYVTLGKGGAVCFVALGAKERVAAREAQMRDMFTSLTFGEGQIDKALVGTWHYWSYRGTAEHSTEVRRTLTLAADGTFSVGGNIETFMSVKVKDAQTGEDRAHAAAAGQHDSTARGKWYAGDGCIHLMFDDGTFNSYAYRIEGQEGNRQVYVGTDKMPWTQKKVQ